MIHCLKSQLTDHSSINSNSIIYLIDLSIVYAMIIAIMVEE